MIITRLAGGMGNQMFQYAAARSLAHVLGTGFRMDLSFLEDREQKIYIRRDYDLDIFNIRKNVASLKDVYKFMGGHSSRLNRFLHRVGRKFNPRHVIKEPHFQYMGDFLKLPKNSYLIGYWQSPGYFAPIEDIIRREFTFKEPLSANCHALKKEIIGCNSVCLNVRRTDMVTNPNSNFTGTEYFDRAMEIMSQKHPHPRFFVFSDDIKWCESHIKSIHPVIYVKHDYAGDKFKDYLNLMMNCRHFIIPNSTFAWWAAWLNVNPGKFVIAPKQWFKDSDIDTSDLIPDSWLRI